MLLEKQKTTPYVGVFKLSTGEEIITNVIEETVDTITIKNPVCMVPTQKGYQFAPWLMMADASKPIPLARNLIVAGTVPEMELGGQYESAISGIALPQKSKIIT